MLALVGISNHYSIVQRASKYRVPTPVDQRRTRPATFLAAARHLSDPALLRNIRRDLPIYLFSGSEDPVGQQLKGVRTLMGRYWEAGIRAISADFYPGGRHEMLNEVNRDEVQARLLGWIGARVEERVWLETMSPAIIAETT